MALSARLTAGRLCLRPPMEQDGPAVIAGLNDLAVSRWLGRVPHPYGKADFAAWVDRSAARGGRWVIEEAGQVLGAVTLEAELGYWLAPAAQGRGIATAAARAVLADHFADPAFGPVQAGYYLGNAASARVLAKLGFQETMRDRRMSAALGLALPHVGMALDRADWAARHPLVIETARLRLAPLQADRDGPDLARIGGDPRVARNLFSVLSPWPEPVLRGWITASQWRGCLGFRLGIWRDGALIGSIGIGGRPCSVSYFLGADHWGQGYATEALAGLLRVVFDRFALDGIEADHFADNPASGAVLRKLGFRQTGTGLGESAARAGLHPNIAYHLDAADFARQHGAKGDRPC